VIPGNHPKKTQNMIYYQISKIHPKKTQNMIYYQVSKIHPKKLGQTVGEILGR
jgi:hypothetical protein